LTLLRADFIFVRMHRLFLSAVCLAWLAVSLPAQAESAWPEFRGPTGQGDSSAKGLPVRWSATQNIAWKQAIPGHGWSSPVLDQNRIYLTTAVEEPEHGDKLSLRVLALDQATGRTVWSREIFSVEAAVAARIHSKNSKASPTPLLAGGRLYAHFGHHGTACLDLDGQVLWRSTQLKYPPVHGNGGSPVLVGHALIFSCDGASDPFMAALDKDTGKMLWKTARETSAKKKFSFSTPLVITQDGRTQVISPGSGAVFAYDPQDGKELWRVRYGEGYSVVPRPVSGQGLIFLSSGFDRPMVMAIRPGGSGDVTESHVVWTLTKGAPTTPSLLLVGTELYFVSDGGIASCVDALKGTVHWSERLGGNFSASPVHADGHIYFQNEEGTTVVVQPGIRFEKLGENALGERTLASSAVTDGAIYIRTEQHLFKVRGG
jgi:outer membrane protein assembly factor BamB